MISHSHSRSRRAPQPRIVVADDSLEMSRLVALMLGTHGFDVVIAPDGDVALSTILTDGADGLVSDFQMPGLDGLTLCRVLRGLRAYAMLPIVIFTGVEDRDPRLRPLRDIEELRILHKPMGLREIGPSLMEMIPAGVTGLGKRDRAGTVRVHGGDIAQRAGL
jgi:DNA-binding response OmpR family regulator